MRTSVLFASVGPDATVEMTFCSLSTDQSDYAARALERWAAATTLNPALRAFPSAVQRDFVRFVETDPSRPADLHFSGDAPGPQEMLFVRCSVGGGLLVSRDAI